MPFFPSLCSLCPSAFVVVFLLKAMFQLIVGNLLADKRLYVASVVAMRKEAFQELLNQAGRLTPGQRIVLTERLSELDSGAGAGRELQHAVGFHPLCPSCHSSRCNRWGHMSGLQRFRCKDCGRTFNLLSGTPLARLRLKDRWLAYAECLEQGLTVRASAKLCEVNKKTSFRWRHRFLNQISKDQAEDLEGVVEVDETFFRESMKGNRHLLRPARKRGTRARQRGRSKAWINVVTIRDRSGATRELILKSFNSAALIAHLAFSVRPDAILCTDGSPVYRTFARAMALEQESVNVSGGERVRKSFHVQNVNAYHSRLKGWIQRFHGVATRYLPNYLGWHRLLDGHESTLSPTKLMRVSLGREHYQRITGT